VALAADITGAPRKTLYPFALAERDRPPPGGPPERYAGGGTTEADAAETGAGEAAGPADPDAQAPT
jgi:hypothetical protein